MASRRGLTADEIQEQLDRLLADDEQGDIMPGIPTDVQSDVEDSETEYEDDSNDDDVDDITDPLQYLSCGLAPRNPAGQTGLASPAGQTGLAAPAVPTGHGVQPDVQQAGSSRDTIGSSAPGWRPDLPPMPSDLPPMPSDQRTSPYPSRRSEHRTPPPTVSKLSIIFNALDLNDILA